MHGLILAGGEGSRLSAEGLREPKPLLRVAGEPLVTHLLDILGELGCETLTCMVRADFGAVFRLLEARRFARPVRVRPCSTPSSLHTLAAGLEGVPDGPVFCTMVDTVMPPADWQGVYEGCERALAAGADVVLVVTPFVDDESPLYVSADGAGRVLRLSDDPIAPPCVTGGVYGLGPAARTAAVAAVRDGRQRMRGFLAWLVSGGARVETVTVQRIIDIDHESDLRLANAWLGSPEAQG